jgi:hypothetical protein
LGVEVLASHLGPMELAPEEPGPVKMVPVEMGTFLRGLGLPTHQITLINITSKDSFLLITDIFPFSYEVLKW